MSEFNKIATLELTVAAQALWIERLVKALADAAQSLETISNGAGRDEFLGNFVDVRGYARNRASVARAALPAKEA